MKLYLVGIGIPTNQQRGILFTYRDAVEVCRRCVGRFTHRIAHQIYFKLHIIHIGALKAFIRQRKTHIIPHSRRTQAEFTILCYYLMEILELFSF